MTRTAVLFVDSKKRLDGVTNACVPITDVPLVKRILIDLRRAGIENILAVMDERTVEIEEILDDTRRTNFHRLVFGERQWRDELLKSGESHAIVLTADRLSDHHFLEMFASTRVNGPHTGLIAVDLKAAGEGLEPEKRYTPNDGKWISQVDVEAVPSAREVGIYQLPVSEIAAFERFDAVYIRERTEQFKQAGKAEYFDIGNGFVEVIDSKPAVRRAEQRIIRYIWKSTDGIHGRTNKRLVLPLLKLLLRTSVTPNMVSLLGVIVSIFSGYFYFRGHYEYTVLGGVLALGSSLLDHVDGSIARIKSKESAFGAHFDTVCDYVFYISFGIGATVGLYKVTSSPFYVWLGVAILVGTILSLIITTYNRNNLAENASLYAAEAHKKLEANLQNPIVRVGRKVYFVARRPALPYYLLFFTVVGLLPFVLFMMALGTNLFWMFHIYTNRFFTPQPKKLN